MVVIRVGELFSHKKKEYYFFALTVSCSIFARRYFIKNADYKKNLKLTELYL